MSEKYLTTSEAVEKYKLNLSKVQLAIRFANKNGLYKCIFRKRTRLFFRQEYLEKWLQTNDVVSPCRPRKTDNQTTHSQSQQRRIA